MAGLVGLSIDPAIFKGKFSEDLFFASLYLQHLGEKHCGLASSDGTRIHNKIGRGHLRSSFMEIMDEFDGVNGIGYCGSNPEPIPTKSKFGECSLCFAGNIINRKELISGLMDKGITFDDGEDVEIIIRLITQGKTIVDGIKIVAQRIKGAYSLVMLTRDGVYASVSSDGHWPLVVGEKEGAVVVSSESGGLDNLGFSVKGDVRPGEVLFLKNGRIESKELIQQGIIQICSFLWVYTAFPNGIFQGIPASLVRKRLCGILAQRDIDQGFIPHFVIPVPDSGRFHAIGYHQEFCRQMMLGKISRIPLYDEFLLKYSAGAGRSFTRSTKEKRDREARIKILKSGETASEIVRHLAECWGGNLSELIVVICDDSIVRGTQLQQNLVPKLKSLGIKEVHVRIANPQLLSFCPWGKTTKKGELLAERMTQIGDRVKHLGVAGLAYSTVEDLVKAIGLPRESLCIDCSLPTED